MTVTGIVLHVVHCWGKKIQIRYFMYVVVKRTMDEKKRRVVEVEWFDAQSSMESLFVKDIQEELKPLYTKSVGYILHRTADYIVLGFTDFGDGLIKHHQVIPKKMIVRETVLRDGFLGEGDSK
jgi:hypothetical protein